MAGAAMQMNVALLDQSVRDMLARMATFGEGPLDAMDDAIGAAMVASTQLRFRAQHDPFGNPWKPSKRALKEHGKTLIERGFLLASITHNTIPGKGVEWGSPMVYAGVHQFGADITFYPRSQRLFFKFVSSSGELKPSFAKKSKSNFSKWATISHPWTVHIPARPYLGIGPEDQVEISEIAQRHLAAAILGASARTLQ